MRIQAILGVLGTALVTCALVLAIARTKSADTVHGFGNTTAAAGLKDEVPAIPCMEMDAAGCHIKVSTDKAEYQPGDSPTLTLTAKNLTNRPVQNSVQLQILATAIPSLFARVMPVPQSVWAGDCLVSLTPGETKSFVLKADAELAAGQLLTITMTSGDQKAQLNQVKVTGGQQGQPGDMLQFTSAQAPSET